MRRGMTRGGGLVSAVLGLVLVLSACTTSAEVETEPTSRTVVPTVEPTPTPTPTPTPDIAPEAAEPERPEAMGTADSAGAEALAVYYLSLFPYVHATGDLDEWEAFRHPECIFCADVARTVSEMAAAGNRTEGGAVEVANVSSSEITPDHWWLVKFDLVEQPSRTVDSGGVTVEDFPGTEKYLMEVAITYEAGSWSVRAVSHTLVE